MQITLNLTDTQLSEMIQSIKENPAMQSVYWQLMGYDMVGGDESAQTPILDN